MASSKDQLEAIAAAVPYWWHSIDLGQGVVTDGQKSAEYLAGEVERLRLPDLRGKSVLDVGAWDGFYSFEAERRGAARVVALDYPCWASGFAFTPEYERQCRERGVAPDPRTEPRNVVWPWDPVNKPGKRAFDTAHRALGSRVESVFADFMQLDPGTLGTFDVVLYLGVLYHMEDPIASLKRVAALTREVAVVETHAVAVPGFEQFRLCEFYEGTN